MRGICMEKIYIIITPTIYLAAGSQIYTRNKVEFLKKKGWDVIVISSSIYRAIMIEELRPYEKYVFKELTFNPYLFIKRKRNETLIKLLQLICNKKQCEVVIESHTINLALWGELIAKECKGKHIVYLLSEGFGDPPKHILDFLNFKHKRKELAGISDKSLEILFNEYKTLKDDEKYSLKAVCTNAVEDLENSLIDDLRRMDVNIASIGRLDKSYVYGMIEEIITFSINNSHKKIQLILVGDSKDRYVEDEILNNTKKIDNLKVIITGRLFPIPKRLFDKVDIFIGLAGSARISAALGVPTVVLDVRTNKAVGVLGFDTNRSLFGDINNYNSISDVINRVLNNYAYYRNIDNWTFPIVMTDYFVEFENHMKFIDASEIEQQYFNGYYNRKTHEQRLLQLLLNILGTDLFTKITQNRKLIEIRRKIKKK